MENSILKSGVDIFDDNIVNKTGLGCGVDITQTIGEGNCKTQILDYDKLVKDHAVECDVRKELCKKDITGSDYDSMTQSINSTLAGGIGASFLNIAFHKHLDVTLSHCTKNLDIYEYGMSFLILKNYSLNIKASFISSLRNYMDTNAWEEINASGQKTRTDKEEIKKIFSKYGTHISTQAFYGCMMQSIVYREKNEWESSMQAMVKVSESGKAPIPETGITIDESFDCSITDTDQECYKHSCNSVDDIRIGGDSNKADLQQWLDSCTPDNPSSNALLGYCFNNSSDESSGLIPLYELLDKYDERRKYMQEAMDEYIEEKTYKLEKRKMVILDIYAKRFGKGQSAPSFCYGIDGNIENHNKYFRLDENVYDHVTGITNGCLYFYYALGHAIGNAVFDVRFDEKGDFDGDWQIRGSNSNEGVTGCLKDRYVGVKIKNVNNGVSENEFVTGFGLEIDKKLRVISKGTEVNFNWTKNGDCESWYSSGLIHDDVYCKYTKDKLNQF